MLVRLIHIPKVTVYTGHKLWSWYILHKYFINHVTFNVDWIFYRTYGLY